MGEGHVHDELIARVLTRARAAREQLLKLPEHRTRLLLEPCPVDVPRRAEQPVRAQHGARLRGRDELNAQLHLRPGHPLADRTRRRRPTAADGTG